MSMTRLPLDMLARCGRYRSVWLVGPLLLYVWTLSGPFVFDDLHLVLKAERRLRGESSVGGLFEFATTSETQLALAARGTIPWWTSARARAAFFRPLAEASFYLDMLLFGRNPLGHRLMSLGWFALALACVHRLFAAVSGDTVRAGAATFLFGLSQTVMGPVVMVANRSDLLVVVGVSLASVIYWNAARGPRWQQVAWALAAFAFALLSKETAIALAGVLAMCELFTTFAGRPPGAGRSRLAIAIALVLLVIPYLAFYFARYPFRWTSLQHASSPIGTIGGVVQAAGLYLAVWTMGFPVNVLWQSATNVQTIAVAVAGFLLALAVVRYLLRSSRGDRGIVFFSLWTLLFMLPALLTVVEPRAICVASVGWSYLLAGLLLPSAGHSRAPPLIVRHWLLTANGLFNVACVLVVATVAMRVESQARERLVADVKSQSAPVRAGDTIVIAAARDAQEIPFAVDRLELTTGLSDVAVEFLTAPAAGVHFIRQDDHTLRIQAGPGGLFNTPLHQLTLGPNWRPRLGERFVTRDFVAEVTAVSDGDVREVRLRFTLPLTSKRLHFCPPAFEAVARSASP